jgi:hypothetical protein
MTDEIFSDAYLAQLPYQKMLDLVKDGKVSPNQARRVVGLPIYVTMAIEDQPPPKASAGPAMQDLVLADIEERKRIGLERYGQLLLPHTGRDALVDLYQELLDAVMYTRQVIYERDHPKPLTPHLYELPNSLDQPCAICGRPVLDKVHQ